MMSFSSSSTRICFNSLCNDALERPRKGWRRRTGEFADLCDRCASTYEEGKFCETFHMNASGWRCCESCGKQIHCGCIVSFHTFVLLDAGGIECMTCARKSFILTPNPAWPPPSLFLPALPDRIKDLSAKNWDPIAESGPVPWRQAPSLFSSSARSGLQPRMPFEVDLPNGIDRLITTECLSAPSLEKKKLEDSSGKSMNGSLKFRASEILANGKEGNGGEQDNPVVNDLQKASFSANEVSMSHIGMAVCSALPNEANGHIKAFGSHVPRPMSSQLLGKLFSGHNGADTSGESQLRNGKPRGDGQLRNQLLPRYRPRITDQELQQISGNSSSVITPLFEKMLSASDAGRIGRLVLPKKCAEAYFPSISQPEGSPLKVQDSKGNEWIFQFRFWPNNNSRMYVLEGVTPCIQSMQLQAGDIVTFSRIEPEGKLVMGFRKASTPPPSDKGTESVNATSRVSTKEDVSAKKTKPGEVLSTPHHLKGNSLSPCNLPIDQANPADQASPKLKDDKSGCVATEVLGAKSSIRSRKKNSTLASKVKRLKIEDEHVIELKLTWEQAQGLLRPPPNYVPGVVVIEGVEFEEYEDAPIIGRPTIFAANCVGEKIQWAQCEDCFKLRKVPFDALLPSRWTCSENSWDPERSFCSVAQELTAELEYLLPASKPAASKKRDPDSVEDLEGLDALANLAIQEEGGSPQESSQTPTTKHPRHRPGCSCVICIQPPSGKGPKHKQTCTCTICLMVKRRFQTLMLRREKKQSEKEAEIFPQQKFQQHPNISENVPEEIIRSFTNVENRSLDRKMMNGEDFSNDDVSRITSSVSPSSVSPFKGQIDLNSQPERDDELSPRPDSDVVKRIMENAFERDLRLHFCNRSRERNNSEGDQTRFGGLGLEG